MPTMSYTLYLPRRHRRRLFFPPGLLALAWLLWLGCVEWRNSLITRPYFNVLPSTFPSLYGSDFTVPKYAPPTYLSEYQLAYFKSWQTVIITGNLWNEFFEVHRTKNIISQLSDKNNKGLIVHFERKAKYSSFIHVIDYLQQNSCSYWIDIRHDPTTIYAFKHRRLLLPPI
ncbi:hypothetical protein HER32_17305 [Hymenobacter sp. BT18]|uniref:hypothetical protein n=1 Tax=Hymenobacter sp. BT18 TaxID=2835648 RepID=UPI00143E599F|nr:hypothetical protein [Hymenobacter sp. BT18]QIX62835.1 hypothetical protein HER32_17305 [Hymenobacter sp. BT18]